MSDSNDANGDGTEQDLPPPYLYKNERLTVPQDEPWKHDKLDRKKVADKLWQIIEPTQQPFVMSLSANYGMGKTTFIECWRQDLKNKGVKSILFNAWETDFSHDAFAAFVSAFEKEFSSDEKVKAKLLDTMKHVGSALIRNTPKLIATAAVKKAIGKDAEELLKEFEVDEDDVAGIFAKAAEASFKNQKSAELSIEVFKDSFEKFVVDECDGRLIVFIDELDRCRPNYAVEVLERIKHLFLVKGVIFVLGVDRDQLLNSISGVYGTNLDSEGYIKKFIDWNFELPEPDRLSFVKYLFSDIFRIENTGNLRVSENSYDFLLFFSSVTEAYEISLRTIEQIFTKLRLVTSSQKSINAVTPQLICMLLKEISPKNFQNLIHWYGNGAVNQTDLEPIINKIHQWYCDKDKRYYDQNHNPAKEFIYFLSRATHGKIAASYVSARVYCLPYLAKEILKNYTKKFGEPFYLNEDTEVPA